MSKHDYNNEWFSILPVCSMASNILTAFFSHSLSWKQFSCTSIWYFVSRLYPWHDMICSDRGFLFYPTCSAVLPYVFAFKVFCNVNHVKSNIKYLFHNWHGILANVFFIRERFDKSQFCHLFIFLFGLSTNCSLRP
jgi:hypothetical protein